MKIMDQIYNGDIKPCEQIIPENASYEEASQTAEELLVQLEKELISEQYEQIENLCQQFSSIADGLAEESFKYGLSMGLKLMKEADDLLHVKEKGN